MKGLAGQKIVTWPNFIHILPTKTFIMNGLDVSSIATSFAEVQCALESVENPLSHVQVVHYCCKDFPFA